MPPPVSGKRRPSRPTRRARPSGARSTQTAPDPAVELGSRTDCATPDTYRYAAHPPRPGNPPPPLTRFELDERGFIAATPEGTETPDGVVIYAGSPPSEPPPTPPRAAPQVWRIRQPRPPTDPTCGPRPRPEDLTTASPSPSTGTPEQRRETEAAPVRQPPRGDAGDIRAPGAPRQAVDVSLTAARAARGFAAIVEDTRAAARDPVSPISGDRGRAERRTRRPRGHRGKPDIAAQDQPDRRLRKAR